LFEQQGQPLVDQGVDVLILGGGIPMLLFRQIRDHRVGAAPVINGIPIVVKMAEMAVKLRDLSGLGGSRVSDYAKAPEHVIEEFLTHPKGL
jgi:allantoin racemase